MEAINQIIQDQIASINQNPMAINISQPNDHQFIVNGKQIYKDANNNWIATEELTINESKAFRLHLEKVTGGRGNNQRP